MSTIEHNGKMYRRLEDGEVVEKDDLITARGNDGMKGCIVAGALKGLLADRHLCYYREVQPKSEPETPAPIEDGGPAFSVAPTMNPDGSVWYHGKDSMTLRQYAAIKLRVPQSGLDWLDDMIRESQRNEFAGQALAGYLACPDTCDSWTHRVMAVQSYLQADQMLQAKEVLP